MMTDDKTELVEQALLDEIAEAISDTLDMDWQPSWAAPNIIAIINRKRRLARVEGAKAMQEPTDEEWLVARVSRDTKIIGIDHPTEADWNDVLQAHIALRDRLNVRIAGQQNCPHKPPPSTPRRSQEVSHERFLPTRLARNNRG